MSEGQGHSIFDKAKDLKDKVTDAIRPDDEEQEEDQEQDESVQSPAEGRYDEMRAADDDTTPDDRGGMAL